MKVVRFSVDTKHRKQWFTGLSFSHPAKMMLPLQLWLIENFTKEGETILDPMAGSGTVLVACSMGRHVIAVELEQKFVDMMKGNWQKIQERGCQMGYTMGKAQIIQGDARNLTGILADKCIFSPPYASGGHHADQTGSWGGQAQANTKEQANYGTSEGQIGQFPYGQIDKIISSPPYEGSVSSDKDGIDYSKGTEYGKPRDRSKDASFQRHYGKGFSYTAKVDAVISSKLKISRHNGIIEYDECKGKATSGQSKEASTSDRECREASPMADRELSERKFGAERSSRTSGFEPVGSSQSIEVSGDASEIKRQSGRTSPPMAGRVEEISRGKLADTTQEGTGKGPLPMSDMPRADRPSSSPDTLPDKQGQQPDQSIEFMRSVSRQSNGTNSQSSPQGSPQTLQTPVDCVISSPPYTTDLKKDRTWMEKHYEGIGRNPKGQTVEQYSPPEGTNNIGNLKSDFYLSAMLQVYQQCYHVLKPGGLMVLVVKNFIRNKAIVRLDTDTIKLCEQAGFIFQDRWYRELTSQSFWRTIYKQKFPDAPEIKFEDILIFIKG